MKYKDLIKDKTEIANDLIKKSSLDIETILKNGGYQNDLYKECWLAGFIYAGERINKIIKSAKI
jgi:hypothetical protein